MNILILGNGGREHALAWKLKQSQKVKEVYVAPGNGGTAQIAKNIAITSTGEITSWLKTNKVDLVVVGPDNYLAEGIVDKVQELGIRIFGPSKTASEIEWSKSFAKQFMQQEGIPTANSKTFTDYAAAIAYLHDQSYPLVIKASGLALGKGVVIAENAEEAKLTLQQIMLNKVFGQAGDEVLIEEYLYGKEISIHAFCDGEGAILFPAAQDHKRIYENDKGPNTGGMGTIAPVPWVSDKLLEEIKNTIVMPTLKGLKKRGREFKGILFPGVMITNAGPKVIEFNARFGDPETQSYMRILETDLVDILLACVEGNLEKFDVSWSGQFACCVVCASGGYPGKYRTGLIINGIDRFENSNIKIFHAGTQLTEKSVVTNGGRVLGITATSSDLTSALSDAYKAIEVLDFEGMQYRKDIGEKSI